MLRKLPFLAACTLLSTAEAAEIPWSTAGYTLEADRFEGSFRDQVSVLYGAEIRQGEWALYADRVEIRGDEENGEWLLQGAVRVRGPGSEIDAEAGTIQIQGGRIRQVVLTGNPVTLEQRLPATGVQARGRADALTYDLDDGLVRLAGDAFVTYSGYEIQGPVLTYDMSRQQLYSGTQPGADDERVRIRIDPKTSAP